MSLVRHVRLLAGSASLALAASAALVPVAYATPDTDDQSIPAVVETTAPEGEATETEAETSAPAEEAAAPEEAPQATAVNPAAVTYHKIPHTELTVVSADSEELTGEGPNGRKELVADGDPATYWHTRWQGTKDPMPHELVVQVGQNGKENIGKIDIVPRQGNGSGRAHEFEVYATNDADPASAQWQQVATGQWEEEHARRFETRSIELANPVTAKYLKFKVLSAWGGFEGYTETVSSMAEFEVYTQTGGPDVPPPPPAGPSDPVETFTIASDNLTVTLDSRFPQVRSYRLSGSNAEVLGRVGNPIQAFRINGQDRVATVGEVNKAANQATYPVTFADLAGVSFNVVVTVDGDEVEYKIDNIVAPAENPLHMVEIPGLDIVSVSSAQQGAKLATAISSVDRATLGRSDTFLDITAASAPQREQGAIYAFANTDAVAVALETNAIYDNNDEQGNQIAEKDNHRWFYSVRAEGDAKVGAIRPGAFTYQSANARAGLATHSKYGTMTEPAPYVKLKFTGDKNADSTIDWQDAAIAFRAIEIKGLGWDKVKDTVITRIPFNIVSQATHPFLKTLDDTKRIGLATDNLGQQVMLKGYQAEGHDSAHPDYADNYNFRAGGLEDIKTLANEAVNYNASIGVHVNVTEQYSEAKNFGNTPFFADRPGWNWMNQAWIIDGRADLGTGEVLRRFQQFRDEAPANLDWLYIDVFYDSGWKADRLARELNKQGWRVGSEWADKFERYSMWSHWANDEKYGGTGNKGLTSQIIRFIDNHSKDNFNPHPVLGYSQIKDFEGWTGHVNWNEFYFNIWENNLPVKFLQQSAIMKWDDAAGQITFENGTVARGQSGMTGRFNSGSGTTFTYDGAQVLNGQTYLLPWKDNGTEEGQDRLYHFNPAGGQTTWTLTNAWRGQTSLALYKLTNQGRVKVTDLPVDGGNVTITAEANQPYVLYPSSKVLDAQQPRWGQSSLIVDPGFNAGNLEAYQTTGEVTVSYNERGQYEAKIGAGEGSVAQVLNGGQPLPAGTYSAWAYLAMDPTVGGRPVAVSVTGEGVKATKYQPVVAGVPTTRITQTTTKNATASDQKFRFYHQRVRVTFKVETPTAVTFKVAAGAGQVPVLVDDLRIVKFTEPKDPAPTDQTVLFEDFEHTDTGYWPFVTGPAQGGDARTQLARKNPPFTQKGWNPGNYGPEGKLIDDVWAGDWSLRLHEENSGLVLKTTPQSMPFTPGHRYRVSFEYQNGLDGMYNVVVGYDSLRAGADPANTVVTSIPVPARHSTETFTHEFVAGSCGAYWLGVTSDGSARKQGDFAIDNLRVEDLGQSADELPGCAAADILLPQGQSTYTGGVAAPIFTVITNNESTAITDVTHALVVPEGWTVVSAEDPQYPVRVASLAPGATSYAAWIITPLVVPTNTEVTARATYQHDGKARTVESSSTLTVLRGLQGGTNYLSDLPFLRSTNGWGPVERDQSNGEQAVNDGLPIVIGDNVAYPKGLGAHANSSIEFDLAGKCEAFTAHVGLADVQQGRGRVGFEVWGDGQKLAESPVIARKATHNFNVDITGVRTLRLVVNDGGNGIGNDHGNWGDAKVTCGAATPSPTPTPTATPSPTPSPTATPTEPPADQPKVDRVSGRNRVLTALEAMKGGNYRSDVVVLATASSFADALAATPLADALDAPVLLTGGKQLEQEVITALADGGKTKVVIAGGTGSVSAQVEADLKKAGIQVERHAGKSRYETSLALAKAALAVDPAARVLVADGADYADALAAGGAANRADAVLVLTDKGKMPRATEEFLVAGMRTRSIVTVGGNARKAATDMGLVPGVTFQAIAGRDRYATAAALADAFGDGVEQIVVASGSNFPDALAGGALSNQRAGLLLLTPAGKLAPAAAKFLADRQTVKHITIVGGTASVSEAIKAELEKLLK